MKQHNIKLSEKFCDAVFNGEKTFEVRVNDRHYAVGDLIKFIPINGQSKPFQHNIAEKLYYITYLLDDCSEWGIQDGYVVFGIKPVHETAEEKEEDTR